MEEQRRSHGGGSAITYTPEPGRFDEAFAPDGTPRAHYAALIEEVEQAGPGELARALGERIAAERMTFDGRAFDLDPVPRVITAAEWRSLEAGLVQRARALESFLDDAYGDQRIVRAGVIPARVIETCEFYEPRLRGAPVPGGRLAVCGFDVVRNESGELMVLEDNLRTPSGIVYALAARELGGAELAERAGVGIAAVEGTPAILADALGEVAGDTDGAVVVLTDGPGGAYPEHSRLARETGALLVTPGKLERDGGTLRTRTGERVGLVYRRSDEDRLWDAETGEETELGRLLAAPVLAGRVAVANAFGAGLGDDKLTHGYVERMIRFYLSEDPLIESVPSVDLEVAGQPAATLANLDEMVVKPRDGQGGQGVAVPEDIGAAEREELRRTIRASHQDLVAQVAVPLSTAPCVSSDEPARLEPHLVDLRAFVLACPGGFRLAPAALTRFAPHGSAKVNSSSGGGAKDTWVLA
jgi:uncharacterized circularly permuted ATP-grasp superfamily protein